MDSATSSSASGRGSLFSDVADQTSATLKRVYNNIIKGHYTDLKIGEGKRPVDVVAILQGSDYGEDEGKTLTEVVLGQKSNAQGLVALHDWQDEKRCNMSYRAAVFDRSSLLQALLDVDLQWGPSGKAKRNPVAAAATHGSVKAFDVMMKHSTGKALLSQPDPRGYLPMHLAARGSSLEMLEAICRRDLKALNAVAGDSNNTPLHCALLEYGRVGRDAAELEDRAKCVVYLIGQAAVFNRDLLTKTNHDHREPLHLAAAFGVVEAVQALLARGVHPRALDAERNTPLHLAARAGHVSIARVLCKYDPSLVTLVNRNTQTPLEIAQTLGLSPMATYLNGQLIGYNGDKVEQGIQIRNIVFKGGGVKGIAEIGAWRELEKHMRDASRQHLWDVQRVAGTSAGAIMALMVALGYEKKVDDNDDPMLEELTKFNNFDELFDSAPGVEGIVRRAKTQLIKEAPSLGMLWTVFCDSVFSLDVFQWKTFWQSGYLCEGKKLLEKIQDLLVQKNFDRYITFRELHQQGTPKDLWVVATDLTRKCYQVFNWLETPDVCVADAIRCSAAFPVFFKHHYAYGKPDKTGHRSPVLASPMVDGGLMWNYPLNVFRNVDTPESVLGIRIAKRAELEPHLAKSADDDRTWMPSLRTIGERLLGSMQRVESQGEIYEKERSIQVSDQDINTLDGDLTEAKISNLQNAGILGVQRYFRDFGYRFEPGAGRIRVPNDEQWMILLKSMRSLTVQSDTKGKYIKAWEAGSGGPASLVGLLQCGVKERKATLKLVRQLQLRVDTVDNEGRTALILAIQQGASRAVNLLVKTMSASHDGSKGHRPLDAALGLSDEKNQRVMVKALIKAGSRACHKVEKCREIIDRLIEKEEDEAEVEELITIKNDLIHDVD